MKNLRSIVKEWLAERGYDGLYSPDGCVCDMKEIMACGEPGVKCRPGTRRPLRKGEKPYDNNYRFKIGPKHATGKTLE